MALAVGYGASAMAGHLFPVFLKFRGGRGAATGLGVVAALSWKAALAAVVVWALVLLATRTISVASVVASLAVPVAQALTDPQAWSVEGRLPATLFCIMAAVAIVIRHRENLRRVFRGEEPRLGAKKA